MKKLRTKAYRESALGRFFKKTRLGAMAVVGTASVVAVLGGSAANAWGPTRPTFTMEKPASYVTFNSITDDPTWGDERAFTVIKDVTGQDNDFETAAAGDFKDSAVAQDGHTYMVKVFVHNNAAINLNLIAKNTRAMAYLPTASGEEAMIQAMIAADNCGANKDGSAGSPCMFWDEAYIRSDDGSTFMVGLVEDSLRYYNNVTLENNDNKEGFTFKNGTDLLTNNGIQLGYEQMDGNIQGCFEYSGYLTFLVEVTNEPAGFTLDKQFSVNDGEYTHTGSAQPGDTVRYRIVFDNVGNQTLNHVIVKDTLAKNISVILDGEEGEASTDLATNALGLNYIPGSTYLLNAVTIQDNPNGLNLDNDTWTTQGLDIGSYTANSNAAVYYSVKVPEEEQLQCGENIFENTVIAFTDEAGAKLATTQLVVNRTCTEEPGKETEEQPGPPAAGAGIKTATITAVALIACVTVLVLALLKKKPVDKK